VTAAVFAPGAFGADVGAAIVMPAAGAVAAAVVLRSRWALALVVLAPLAGLAALAAADLVLGGDSHLTRSVLEAGGADEAGQAVERRIVLTRESFGSSNNVPYLVALGLVTCLAVAYRGRIAGWLESRAIRAGCAGAVTAAILGALSNDSGAVLLLLGAAYLAATVGFAWSQSATLVAGEGSTRPEAG
jgi:hypothetical protein